jgi:hypothetical protein
MTYITSPREVAHSGICLGDDALDQLGVIRQQAGGGFAQRGFVVLVFDREIAMVVGALEREHGAFASLHDKRVRLNVVSDERQITSYALAPSERFLGRAFIVFRAVRDAEEGSVGGCVDINRTATCISRISQFVVNCSKELQHLSLAAALLKSGIRLAVKLFKASSVQISVKVRNRNIGCAATLH